MHDSDQSGSKVDDHTATKHRSPEQKDGHGDDERNGDGEVNTISGDQEHEEFSARINRASAADDGDPDRLQVLEHLEEALPTTC